MFFEFFKEKSSTFNTGFVSYNVSLQPILDKNIKKTCEGPKNNFKMVPKFFLYFCENFKGLFGLTHNYRQIKTKRKKAL